MSKGMADNSEFPVEEEKVLKSTFDELRVTCENLLKQNEEFLEKAEDLRKLNRTGAEQYTKLTNTKNRLDEQNTELTGENNALRSHINFLEKEVAKMRGYIDRVQEMETPKFEPDRLVELPKFLVDKLEANAGNNFRGAGHSTLGQNMWYKRG